MRICPKCGSEMLRKKFEVADGHFFKCTNEVCGWVIIEDRKNNTLNSTDPNEHT